MPNKHTELEKVQVEASSEIEPDDPKISRNSSEREPDIFDNLADLCCHSQDYTELAGVKQIITRVPIGRRDSQTFVRVHPDPRYRSDFYILEFKEERSLFLVHRPMVPLLRSLEANLTLRTLFTATSRAGVLHIWPVKLLDPSDRYQGAASWATTERAAAQEAMKRWVRTVAKMELGGYETFAAQFDLPDPIWPDMPYNEMIRIAFGRENVIDREDHPAILRLKGKDV